MFKLELRNVTTLSSETYYGSSLIWAHNSHQFISIVPNMGLQHGDGAGSSRFHLLLLKLNFHLPPPVKKKDVAGSECGQLRGTIATDILSSEMLCSPDWQLGTDVSGRPIVPIFRDQAVREESLNFQRRTEKSHKNPQSGLSFFGAPFKPRTYPLGPSLQ